MQRIFILVLVLYIVWRVLSAWGRRGVRDGAGADSFSRFSARSRDRRRRQRDEKAEVGELAACAGCGTYVPADRLVAGSDGRSAYCTDCTAARAEAGAAREP